MELNKAVLDCMRNLRRRLRDEQQLDIHLDQPDAIIATMLSGCLRSTDEQTRELGRQLARLTDQLAEPAAKPTPKTAAHDATTVRIYRGQRVIA